MEPFRSTLGLATAGIFLFACSGLILACSDDDDDPTPGGLATEAAEEATGATGATGAASEEAEEAEEFTRDFIDTYNDGDAEAFFDMMTDEGVAEFLGYFGMDTTDLEAAKEEAAPFIGEDPIDIEELTVTESTASSATVEMIGSTAGILEGDRLELVRQGDEWKVSSLQLYAVSPEIPSDYTTVGMDLQEFAFVMDGQVEAGNIAFAVENTGQQPHEAILAKLDEGVNLDEALRSESEEPPEGVEVIGGIFGLEPGQSYNLVFTEELEPGRYAFVCFFPDTSDPEGTPHAFKGMVQEFDIE